MIFAAVLIADLAFDDVWDTRIKPPPYPGIATEFTDRLMFDGSRINPHKEYVCAHMLEKVGQRLLVTNIMNGKSVECVVRDRGPNRKFWPRREIDLTPPVSDAIECDGKCLVEIERLPAKRQ
jgi:rare lipoprotein A (peptidoglycan hydrolase)